jgi:hypothetical protein
MQTSNLSVRMTSSKATQLEWMSDMIKILMIARLDKGGAEEGKNGLFYLEDKSQLAGIRLVGMSDAECNVI